MQQPIKYRLGNQPEEFELSEQYLGWMPQGFSSWNDLIYDDVLTRRSLPLSFDLTRQDGEQTVSMIFHQMLSKDAFPLEFFGEERSRAWHRFAIVSLEEEPWALFIIPLH